MKSPLAYVKDSLRNFTATFNVAGDKQTNDEYVAIEVTPQEIEAAFRTSWYRKICTIPPEDMTRQWRQWYAEPDQIEAIEALEKKLGLQQKAGEAMTWARAKGGALLLLGLPTMGDPKTPLDIEKVGQDALEYVHALDKDQVSVSEYDWDLASPWFGGPKFYTLTSRASDTLAAGSVEIHPSRVIRFIGNKRMPGAAGQVDAWGDSLWQLMRHYVMDADRVGRGMASLIHEAKVDIIAIPDLLSRISTDEFRSVLDARFAHAALLKSMNNLLLLDKEEEFSRKEINFSGLPDIQRIALAIMAGIADIPATRLLGKSPDGMNATGDNDLRNYYDMLKSKQGMELTPALEPLDEIIIRSATGSRDENIYYEWRPLWQMTPAEKADVDKKHVEIATAWVNSGLVPDEAMVKAAHNLLVEDGTFPGIEEALEEAEDEGAEPGILEEPTPEELAAEAAAGQGIPLGGAAPGKAKEGQRPPAKKPALKLVGKDAKIAAVIGAAGRPIALNDATPRTLYVHRQVINAGAIIEWARAQGFEEIEKPEELHVTIAYSETPIDWMKAGAPSWGNGDKDGKLTIAAGGPRVVEPLGPNGAVVLFFSSWELTWRHAEIRRAGASYRWEEYQPHVTISYAGSAPEGVKPYNGPIEFGPEIFEEIKP